jgi:seryl-tRNA synthetase
MTEITKKELNNMLDTLKNKSELNSQQDLQDNIIPNNQRKQEEENFQEHSWFEQKEFTTEFTTNHFTKQRDTNTKKIETLLHLQNKKINKISTDISMLKQNFKNILQEGNQINSKLDTIINHFIQINQQKITKQKRQIETNSLNSDNNSDVFPSIDNVQLPNKKKRLNFEIDNDWNY